MDMQQARTFIELIKTSSFSKAAQNTFRSQPTVSFQIKALEEEFEMRFFERFGPMKVRPTREGLALYEILLPLLKDYDSVKRRLDEKLGKVHDLEIKIASHESVFAYLLPDVVEYFTKKHKNLKFLLFRKLKAEIIDMVTSGEADFGITTLDKHQRGVEYKVFRIHKRVLLTPKDHPLSKIKDLKIKDIAGYPLILPPIPSETRGLVEACFKKKGLACEVSLELAGRDAVKRYVEKGFGISIISDYYLLPQDKEKLEIIDVSNIFGETSRGILYRKGKKLLPVHQELIDYLAKPTTHS